MKALRFSLIALTALLLLAALIAPGLVGPKVEETVKQQLAGQANVELTGYQRGWFGAEALTLLKGKDGATEVYSEIQHGPLLFTRSGPRVGVIYTTTRLSGQQLEPALRRQLETFYGPLGTDVESSPLLLETLVGPNNRVTNTLHLLPTERNEGDQQIAFEGAEIKLVTDYQGKQQDSRFKLGEYVHLDGHREALYVQSGEGTFNLTPSGAGSVQLQLPLVRANNDSGPLELQDVQIDYTGELIAQRTLKVQTKVTLPEIQSATPASALTQQIHLPAISYDDLHHYLYSLLLTPASQRNWAQVFDRPLKMQQQLDIETANGSMQLLTDVDWAGMPRQRQVTNDKLFWLDNLSGTATITAAEQALTQSPLIMQANTLKQYGLLIENNGELTMHLQLERGNLRVNDQPLPADLFILAMTSGR